MAKYLIFDTETSGLPDYAAPADDPNQPHVAEFYGTCIECMDANGGPIQFFDGFHFLVKPDGWEMTPEATAINGLTTQYLIENGSPIRGLLDWYVGKINEGYIMATFNARHDLKMMRGELRRAGLEDHFEQTSNICLMRSSWRKEVGMVKADGTRKGFPKLTDALRHFNLEHDDDHRAMAGALGALAVFIELHRIGMLMEPSVHYAKERPQPPAQGTLPDTMDF